MAQDRPVHLVALADYEALEAFVRRLAQSTPREGQWEKSYRALQEEARALLKR
jgi:hypothetical protein